MKICQCIEILKKLGHSPRVSGAEQQACFIVAGKLQHELDMRRSKDRRRAVRQGADRVGPNE